LTKKDKKWIAENMYMDNSSQKAEQNEVEDEDEQATPLASPSPSLFTFATRNPTRQLLLLVPIPLGKFK
jgi:hypothetical protein